MDVRTSPTTKPEIDRLISPPMAEYLRARSGAIAARMATRIFGASNRRRSTNANTAASDADHRDGTLAQVEGGPAEILRVRHELRGVLVHPGLNVVLADEVTDPALPVLRLVDVARQVVREVCDAVDQWVAEGHRQAGKEEQPPRSSRW